MIQDKEQVASIAFALREDERSSGILIETHTVCGSPYVVIIVLVASVIKVVSCIGMVGDNSSKPFFLIFDNELLASSGGHIEAVIGVPSHLIGVIIDRRRENARRA